MLHGVEFEGERYCRPIDARFALGWTDLRRLRRTFKVIEDPRIVAFVVKAAAKSSPHRGPDANWVLNAAEVETRLPDAEAATTDDDSVATDAAHSMLDRIEALEARVADLTSARSLSLTHREQLLDQIATLHKLGLAQVQSQETLVAELREFEIPNRPPVLAHGRRSG